LREGILGDIGRGVFQGATGMEIPQSQTSINKDAASAAAKLQAQGYGPAGTTPPGKKSPMPSADWKDKLAQAKKDPSVKQYVSQLAQGWAQEAKKIQPSPAPTAPNQSTPSTPTSTASTPTQPVMLGGKRLDPKNPKDAQVLAAMRAQGKLEEAPLGNLGQRAAAARVARTAQRNPGSVATNTTQTDPYQEAFVRWSDAQLASRDPVTYQAITMDTVRAKSPELKAELDRALQAVVSARDTPQSAAAIAQYLELAVAGVQARSQELKNKAPEVATQALSGAQANLGSVQQTLSQVGVNPRALSAFGNKAKSKNVVTTGNAEADALLKQAGFSL
jgi:hypothetical protein